MSVPVSDRSACIGIGDRHGPDYAITSYGVFGGYFSTAEAALALAEAESNAQQRETLMDLALDACEATRRYASVFPIGRPRAELWQGRKG